VKNPKKPKPKISQSYIDPNNNELMNAPVIPRLRGNGRKASKRANKGEEAQSFVIALPVEERRKMNEEDCTSDSSSPMTSVSLIEDIDRSADFDAKSDSIFGSKKSTKISLKMKTKE
jgi:hypothetical protein